MLKSNKKNKKGKQTNNEKKTKNIKRLPKKSNKSNRNIIFKFVFILYLITSFIIIGILTMVIIETLLVTTDSPNYNSHFVKKGLYYFSVYPEMVKDKFLVEKNDNGFRIFILGGSEAMGSPYVNQQNSIYDELGGLLKMPNEGGISTWIEQYLEKLYPNIHIEVINAAKGGAPLAESTHTFNDIIKMGNADLVIILSGNNERNPSEVNDEHELNKNINFKKEVDYCSVEFKKNIDEIRYKAYQYKIPVYFLTVPNNIRDWIPSDIIDNEEKIRIQQLMEKSRHNECIEYIKKEDYLNNSLRLFYIAKCYDQLGDYDNAKKYYIMAKDMDKSFVRTRSQWNNIIRNITSNEYVKVIDIEHDFMKYAKDGIPSYDEFFDYCHMKIHSNKKVSYEIVRHIMTDFFVENDTSRIDSIKLDGIVPNQLKRLYWLKKIKWLRTKYYTPFAEIRNLNTRNIMENYKKEIFALDTQVRIIGSVW